MEWVTFQKFRTEEEALELTEKLNHAGINYQLESIAPPVDVTFTGGNILEDKVALRIHPDDFQKVNGLLEHEAQELLASLDRDYYLFDFSDEELMDILQNYDEWNKMDYLLAGFLLRERGHNISNEKIANWKKQKINQLRQPISGQSYWIVFGYVAAVLTGFIGIAIGYLFFTSKKVLPTGDKIHMYDLSTIRHGKRIFSMGIFFVLLYTVLFLFSFLRY
ncbi:MAG: hypothetical protein JJU02_06430 [Cryomorphaceae bacterium]|nr:hypothetical protein [Cryomorphaceae bacterium]